MSIVVGRRAAGAPGAAGAASVPRALREDDPPPRRAAVAAVVALVALAAGCATAAPAPAPAPAPPVLLDVDVGVLPDDSGNVGGVSLRYCPRTSWPRRLTPESRRALPFLVSAVDDAGRKLVVDVDGVRTQGVEGCARLVVDVGRLADSVDDRDLALRAGDDLVITPDLWLWRPEPLEPSARLYVRIDAAPFDALVPWKPPASGARYEVTPATYALKSDTVFGRFTTETLDAGGARFTIARLDDGRAPEELSSWLSLSANAVSSVLGHYPVPRVNVLVIPTHVTSPIVVGFFSRGGGDTATFFVGEGAPDIADDDLDATGRWALTHELSHPLLPPVAQRDAWLNEGLATLYQDLLARRAGMLEDDAAYWRELCRGLATGEARAAVDGMSLEDASAGMHEMGAYQHAYWGGAGVMLLAEVEARRQGASLDDLVRALRGMVTVDDHARGAKELLDAAAAGADPEAAVAARALLAVWQRERARPFPETAAVLRDLGVSIDAVGGAHLDDRAPLAAIRARITAPRRAPAVGAVGPGRIAVSPDAGRARAR